MIVVAATTSFLLVDETHTFDSQPWVVRSSHPVTVWVKGSRHDLRHRIQSTERNGRQKLKDQEKITGSKTLEVFDIDRKDSFFTFIVLRQTHTSTGFYFLNCFGVSIFLHRSIRLMTGVGPSSTLSTEWPTRLTIRLRRLLFPITRSDVGRDPTLRGVLCGSVCMGPNPKTGERYLDPVTSTESVIN